MGRLYETVNRRQSQDVIKNIEIPVAHEEESRLEKRIREESGPVKTWLDLSEFMVFGAGRYKATSQSEHWITISPRGDVRLSSRLGAHFQNGERIEVLLNRKGTILVLRPAPTGLSFRAERPEGKKTQAKRVCCKALAEKLKELGISLPARFRAEWNDELQLWVGRRQ